MTLYDPVYAQPRRYDASNSDDSLDEGIVVDPESKTSQKRTIGVVSAVFIIFNRIIGTGIFATPSTILRFSGSVGLSLTMWLIGAIVAGAGMQVYTIWGTALPRNGGEKNYLEHLFPYPRRLATSVYASVAVLLAYAAGNSLVFAEYTLSALSPSTLAHSSPSNYAVKLLAFLCLTSALFLHGLHVSAGLRVQNTLGIFKILILVIMAATGYAAFRGHLQPGINRPTSFDSWNNLWEGTRFGGSVICSCLYNVIWSYVGFSNANYALAEMKNPAKTLRIAGPLAIITVTLFYFLCNFAYFSAASKEEITGSGRLVAALLFRNVWGPSAERILSGFVALSALGNVLSVSFSQGRVNQALALEDVLPLSKIIASNWPSGGPLAGLSIHWLACIIVVFVVPSGDAYNFVINLSSYPYAVINTTISFGLIYLSLRPYLAKYHSPSNLLVDETTPLHPIAFVSETLAFKPRLSLIIPALVYGLANVFLFVVPWFPPQDGFSPYEHLPYWTHAAGAWCIFGLGATWWWWHYA